ncbi:MAG: SWIM zinc finger family protein [Xanthobacteraceae bacterium]
MLDSVDVRGDNRQQKGLEIAATAKIVRKGKAWSVPSQTNQRRYTVWLRPQESHCTCPDHEDGGFKCKHIFAAEYVVQRERHPDGSTTVTETLTVRATRKNLSAGLACL